MTPRLLLPHPRLERPAPASTTKTPPVCADFVRQVNAIVQNVNNIRISLGGNPIPPAAEGRDAPDRCSRQGDLAPAGASQSDPLGRRDHHAVEGGACPEGAAGPQVTALPDTPQPNSGGNPYPPAGDEARPPGDHVDAPASWSAGVPQSAAQRYAAAIAVIAGPCSVPRDHGAPRRCWNVPGLEGPTDWCAPCVALFAFDPWIDRPDTPSLLVTRPGTEGAPRPSQRDDVSVSGGRGASQNSGP